MKILIDPDVLLDVALRRAGFFEESAAVLARAETHPWPAAVVGWFP